MCGFQAKKGRNSTCRLCGKTAPTVSEALGYCRECIITHPERTRDPIRETHRKSRIDFGLPAEAPADAGGIGCSLCVNQCRIPEGSRGYCALRKNRAGKLVSVTGQKHIGRVSSYHDELPTNCVGSWVCPGATDAGYPTYSHCRGPEHGHRNLAVFYEACSFNCLFCQNWTFKAERRSGNILSPQKLAARVDERTACICYFGGDPAVQMGHSIETARIARSQTKGKILRICWETNGSMNPALLKEAAALALESGGCIKFDLKCHDENLHLALTGVTNRRTMENFEYLAALYKERSDPPLVIASTPLIPGYVEIEEVRRMAAFIARLEPRIPYSLLAFYPEYLFDDLPLPEAKMADQCLKAAQQEGLKNVRLGNVHLLA